MSELAQNIIPDTWIYNRFGSKTGLMRYAQHESLRLLGAYRRFKPSKLEPPKRLVFVCMGNICRSPLGEAVARQMGVEATSYGLSTRGNDPADPRAAQFAQQENYDLSQHRTRPIEQYSPTAGDWLVCMEPKQAYRLYRMYSATPIALLGLYGTSTRAYIHDPFNTNAAYFEHCEQLVVHATRALVQHVT